MISVLRVIEVLEVYKMVSVFAFEVRQVLGQTQ